MELAPPLSSGRVGQEDEEEKIRPSPWNVPRASLRSKALLTDGVPRARKTSFHHDSVPESEQDSIRLVSVDASPRCQTVPMRSTWLTHVTGSLMSLRSATIGARRSKEALLGIGGNSSPGEHYLQLTCEQATGNLTCWPRARVLQAESISLPNGFGRRACL